jgi:hypothetical protein
MRTIRFLAWLYIFIVPVVFGAMDKVSQMTASILAGCLILAFAYIEKLRNSKEQDLKLS